MLSTSSFEDLSLENFSIVHSNSGTFLPPIFQKSYLKDIEAVFDNLENLTDDIEPRTHEIKPVFRPRWQWKSNSDPWPKAEEPQWTSYSLEQNYCIENAYQEKQKEVDLGEYIVSIKDKIQMKKGNITIQRPIRRIYYDNEEENEDIEMRGERYFETELPKSINKVFGSLRHFISFFSRRNPEIWNFSKLFQKFEQSNDLDGLNKIIRIQLIYCLEEELLRPIEGQLQDSSVSTFRKKTLLKRKRHHEELVALFREEFANFEELYSSIVKSYTMSTDLYLNLNKYLRNENWIAIDNLLPYAFCLCKAFFSFKPNNSFQKGSPQETSLVLYRGTALDEFALSSYKTGKGSKFFSWNSVTSTSANKKMAENFMYLGTDIENKKYPVMFIIEVPPATGSEYLKWIDIHQHSAQPKEDEVILPPGSVFELQQVSTDPEKRTTIKIKLKHDVESLAYEGLLMQGAFQNEVMGDKRANIMCLQDEELSEAFKSLSGNTLIEEIEICLCTFNDQTLKDMLSTLPTLKKATKLRFISCRFEDEEKISNIKLKNIQNFNILSVQISKFPNFEKIFSIQKEYWTTLKTLEIDFRDETLTACSSRLQELQNLSQLTSLTLDLTHEEVQRLKSQGLAYLTQITSLNLSFWDDSFGISYIDSQVFQYPTQLTSLTLRFLGRNKIDDEGVNILISQGLKHQIQLKSLNLNLCGSEITDEGVYDLASQGLRNLAQLASLTLDFSDCTVITDKGVNNLTSEGLRELAQLNSLSLNFSNCQEITNAAVRNLSSQGLKSLTQLTSLDLNFTKCEKSINDEAINDLASHGLQHLTKLSSLTLNFSKCLSNITDAGIHSLTSQGLRKLTELTSLNLNFSFCNEITNRAVNDLASQGLTYITQLASLNLDFSNCDKNITDEGVSDLTSYGLKYLTQLTSLTLNFSWCGSNITDTGVSGLASQGLRHLTQLTSLNLNFSKCFNITDEGVSDFASQGLRELTQLASLNLNFSRCYEITNGGVFDLASQGLKYITQLASLNLNFSKCHQIDDKGVRYLALRGLRYLVKLTSLTLNFSERTGEGVVAALDGSICFSKMISLVVNGKAFLQAENCKKLDIKLEELSQAHLGLKLVRGQAPCPLQQLNKRMTSLSKSFSGQAEKHLKILASQGFESFTQLISLTLCFSGCYDITDEGLDYLGFVGLKYLTKLTSLNLKFFRCTNITDKGVTYLAFQGLRYLTKLTSLTLDFSFCEKITDEGVKNLIQHGIKYLVQLAFLEIKFSYCSIPKSTISIITQLLHYFGFEEEEESIEDLLNNF